MSDQDDLSLQSGPPAQTPTMKIRLMTDAEIQTHEAAQATTPNEIPVGTSSDAVVQDSRAAALQQQWLKNTEPPPRIVTNPDGTSTAIPNPDGLRTVVSALNGSAASSGTSTSDSPLVNTSAPNVIPQTNIELEAINTDNMGVQTNRLDGYMNVTYHIRMSMVHYSDVASIQQNPQGAAARVDSRVFTIASTGGNAYMDDLVVVPSTTESGQSIQVEHHFPFYSINKLNFVNTLSPRPQNPMISQMVEMHATMVQPYGFSIHKDLLRLAHKLEYPEFQFGRIIYKIDIWWSGFDQDTGQWFAKIPVISSGKSAINMISHFVTINTIEASPIPIGTQYEITMSPISAFAYRPEIIIADGGHVEIKGNTFGSFLQSLAGHLTDSTKKISNGVLKHTYKFIAPKVLLQAAFGKSEDSDVTRDVNGTRILQISKTQDIFSIVQSALDALKIRQDLFLADSNNDNFTTPRITFGIRMKVIYGNYPTSGNDINDFDAMEFQYIIEPYITYKTPTITKSNKDKVISADAQMQRLKEMIKYQMIVRKYDYFFTGQNTEVLDFAFKYNAFYYVAMEQPTQSQGIVGQNSEATVSQITEEENRIGVKVTNVPSTAVASSVSQLLGNGTVGEGATIQNTFQGMGRTAQNYGTNTQSNDIRQQTFMNQFDQHLNSDMMVLERMIVRGDPLWIINGYSSDVFAGLTFLSLSGDDPEIHPQSSKIILIRAYAPVQDAYMDPAANFSAIDTTTLGGFYEIFVVDSEFADGKFTQNLHGAKLVHLNYIDKGIFAGNN